MAQVPIARRRWLVVLIAVVIVLVIALNVLSGFYVDLLWFREVGFASVFWKIFWSKVLLGLVFGILFFGLLFVNLLIVRRLTPPYRVLSPEQEVIERYRVAVEPYIKWILPAFSLVIALFVGIAAAGQWQKYLLWSGSGDISFGNPEPLFHRDPSYYVFKLPFLHFVQGWLFSSLVAVTVIVAIGHYVWGGIRLQSVGERVTPAVRGHMSVLLGLIVLVKAWGYYLGRFDLLTSPRGVVTGASYTDVHAQLPALTLLVFIAIACSLLFLVNVRFRIWALPVIGLGLLALASIVAGAIFPAAIQRFSVKPQELQRESPYIARNIAATRNGFGLDQISQVPRAAAPDLSSQQVDANSGTVSNIRLWDPGILKESYDQLQRIRQYYEFQDVDVDRYPLGSPQQERMVMVSAREVSQSGIPSGGSWQNEHLKYTHGYGAVASTVNSSTTEGQPQFILNNIPPVGQPDLSAQPRVYYGERQDVPFVVTNSGTKELDYQGVPGNDQKQVTTEYKGKGGIQIGGFLNRLLFAWRYKDINLLISSLIHGDSKILIYRAIQERIPKPAPFLKYDADPYAAIVDGRLVWIQDAYTTTNAFPYSEQVSLGDQTAGDLGGQANYIRNSVKVVVDAYDGTMTYYVRDPSDPIIRAWESIFPDLFTPFSDASPELQAHFRYPEDLFLVQAQQYARYHVTSPSVFYGHQDFWSLAIDPTFNANLPSTASKTQQNAQLLLRPYYVLQKLPGQASEEFVLISPFTPAGRNNMVAYLAAPSDPSDYGKLVSFEFPTGENVDGPVQVFARINQDPRFSAERSLLGKTGSTVVFGNFLVIPIEDSFLYVQPVFVKGNQQGAFPELKRVLVVHGGTVGIGDTLAGAIANSYGNAAPPPPPNQGPTPTGTNAQKIAQLVAQAIQHFQAANTALQAGDLGTYQKEIQAAQNLIQQANTLATGSGGPPPPTPTPSTKTETTKATPTPTPTK